MKKRRTYPDTNVLLAAFQGDHTAHMDALAILDDPQRELVVSEYLRLETVPKATFNKRADEVDFIEEVFAAATRIPLDEKLVVEAVGLSSQFDL